MVSLIGAHFSRNGIKQFPARVVLSMYGNGIGNDETTADTIVILRDTRIFPSGEAPPDFHTFDPETSGVTWAEYGRYWYSERTEQTVPTTGGPGFRNFKEAWDANQPADYYTICNEQGGGEGPEEEIRKNLTQLVNIERAISQAANADGRKCCLLNLAGGSPGNFELWKEIVAPFIVEAWQNGGNIYGRHVYADDFVDAQGNVKAGQPQRVIDELEYLQSIGYGGGVVLTECGLDGGYGVAGLDRFTFQIQAWEAALRPYSGILIGFCWWECGDTGFHADYTEHLKTLVPYMNNSYLGRWEPPTTQPPDNGQGGDMAYIWKNAIRHHVQGLDIAAAKIACFQSGKVTGQDGKQYDADKFLGFATMDNDGYLVLQPETNVLSLVEYSPDGDENPNPPVSEKFAIGDRVEITANALNVRVVPSLQGTIVTALPKGSRGTVNDGPTLADNVIWWEVAFDADVTGWCSEAWLEYETASKNPLDGLVLGKPFAVPYALTSPFNAPRSYANGLHEGVDYDVLTAVADSQEPILCLYPGTVDISVDSSGGYGKYVRVRHERNGSTFYTRYAHMDERFVSVGQIVDIGDALGEIGTTGNVTGEHVHINLEVPGYGSSGYVVSDVVDPHPYIGSSPTPPPTGKTYPTTFMRGEPGIWRVVRRVDGSGEDIWELPLMSDSDVRVKNANEGEWYEYRADGVYRLRDTSPAPDSQGKERLYLLSINGVLGGKIAPAVAEVGKTYSYTNEVQFKSKANCQNLSENSGLAPSTFLLKEVLDNYTFPETGFKVDRLYVTVQTGEVQLYAERDGRIIGWCGGGANQDNNVWGGVLGEVYYDRAIPQQEPPRFCS